MQWFPNSMISRLVAPRTWAVALLALSSSWASAQALKVEPVPDDPAPPAAVVAPAETGGIRSANIFEIAPDASTDPNYAGQTNAERKQVQPGNNAPMWRDVGKGVTGYSSLPYPESGNLIQGFVQYPGSRLTNAGEAWRQVRNDWLIPYGGSLLIIVAVAIGLF
jgi:formate dehydrogenase subunit gamma